MTHAAVRIVSEVPPTSVEGSERLINELEASLAASTTVRTTRVPLSGIARWAQGAMAAIRTRERADVLHYYPIGSLTRGSLVRARLWRGGTGAPMVFHAFQYPTHAMPSARAIRAAIGVGGIVVSPSPRLVAELRQRGVPARFVSAGVDTGYFRPASSEERRAARELAGVPENEPLALHVGHVRRNRNLGVLIELARTGRRVALVVSPRLHAERALLEELAASGVRILRGTFPEIRMAYWAADVYLFPVVDPRAAVAVPLSVLEALACGLPVVSTRFDGLITALGERWPGVTWSEPDRFAEAVGRVLATPRSANSISAPMATTFGLSAIRNEFLRLYRSLTDGR